MIIGIVGSEESKFTQKGKAAALEEIAALVKSASGVASGECHLGGVDIWARDAAMAGGKEFFPFAPKTLSWEMGYKPRNLQIAAKSDLLVCITVERFPVMYFGMKFPYCYHCHTDTHIKSGGCWTMKQAERMGKKTRLIVVENEE